MIIDPKQSNNELNLEPERKKNFVKIKHFRKNSVKSLTVLILSSQGQKSCGLQFSNTQKGGSLTGGQGSSWTDTGDGDGRDDEGAEGFRGGGWQDHGDQGQAKDKNGLHLKYFKKWSEELAEFICQ